MGCSPQRQSNSSFGELSEEIDFCVRSTRRNERSGEFCESPPAGLGNPNCGFPFLLKLALLAGVLACAACSFRVLDVLDESCIVCVIVVL